MNKEDSNIGYTTTISWHASPRLLRYTGSKASSSEGVMIVTNNATSTNNIPLRLSLSLSLAKQLQQVKSTGQYYLPSGK